MANTQKRLLVIDLLCCLTIVVENAAETDDVVSRLKHLLSVVNTICPEQNFYEPNHNKTASCSEVSPIKKTGDVNVKYCFDNCRNYLACLANILPNGSKVFERFFNETLSTCHYPLYYHLIHGFAECSQACVKVSSYCPVNCRGFLKTCQHRRQLVTSSTETTVTTLVTSPSSVVPGLLPVSVGRQDTASVGVSGLSWQWVVIVVGVASVAVAGVVFIRIRNTRLTGLHRTQTQPPTETNEEQVSLNIECGAAEPQINLDLQSSDPQDEHVSDVHSAEETSTMTELCFLNDNKSTHLPVEETCKPDFETTDVKQTMVVDEERLLQQTSAVSANDR